MKDEYLRNEEGTLSPHKKEEVQKRLASHFLPQVIPEHLFGSRAVLGAGDTAVSTIDQALALRELIVQEGQTWK